MMRFFIFIIGLIVFYYKLLYVSFLVSVFCFEYIFFINYLYLIYKNYYNYYDISVQEHEIYDCSILELWVMYSNLLAYQRLYTFLMRKKIKIRSFLIITIVYILGLPIRLIKIF